MELFHMINPTSHTRSADGVERYRVEPYVVAADVYAHPMHVGRGGWTWYTGSAGWMYRAAIDELLGLRRSADTIAIAPCVPAMWPDFEMDLRFGRSRYRITVDNRAHQQGSVRTATLDGVDVDPDAIPYRDDGGTHEIAIVLGPDIPRAPSGLRRGRRFHEPSPQ
jgi:cyclic beta-1,2-glucan synthetase